MHVAPLQLADAPHYRALMLEAYELATDAFTSTAAERVTEPLSFWEKRIADPSGLSVAFGAFEGGALIGSVALEFSAKPKTKHKGHVIGIEFIGQKDFSIRELLRDTPIELSDAALNRTRYVTADLQTA